MFLSNIYIENFRIFGSEKDDKQLDLILQPGVNILVGENDSGKSAIIDAIRLVLWTTSQEYLRFTDDDFHVHKSKRARDLTIRFTFKGLSKSESPRFLEWLSMDENKPCLYITLKAVRLDADSTFYRGGRNVSITVHAGKNGEGKAIEGKIREYLKITYLRALRDAEVELTAGRGSRLSQILQSHPQFKAQRQSDFDTTDPSAEPRTLVGIMEQAHYGIENNKVILDTKQDLNDAYLSEFSIGDEKLIGEIGISRHAELRYILEKLDLWLRPKDEVELRTPRGLGYNNLLFMATELLLLAGEQQSALPLLLIEEPEAHIHPQMQLRLMDFLEEKSAPGKSQVQVLVTTHSPNLASKADLHSVILVCGGKAYPLGYHTKLDNSDYSFLRRFLDVTKANFFFAKGVVIVEGDAENILLPTLAKLLNRSFSKNGVSIVNVGSRGLFRYARIFERTDNRIMPIRVACIEDRDIPPQEADYVATKKDQDIHKSDTIDVEEADKNIKGHGETQVSPSSVQTFISPVWTFEYDLAFCGLALEMHIAVLMAKRSKNSLKPIDEKKKEKSIQDAKLQYKQWIDENYTLTQIAVEVYKPLYKKEASKAETAQFLAEYLEKTYSTPDELEKKLPEYLVKAVKYVTTA